MNVKVSSLRPILCGTLVAAHLALSREYEAATAAAELPKVFMRSFISRFLHRTGTFPTFYPSFLTLELKDYIGPSLS